jgi:hypothetical protein
VLILENVWLSPTHHHVTNPPVIDPSARAEMFVAGYRFKKRLSNGQTTNVTGTESKKPIGNPTIGMKGINAIATGPAQPIPMMQTKRRPKIVATTLVKVPSATYATT